MQADRVMEPTVEYDTESRDRERRIGLCVRAAILEHKRANNPICVWRNEQVVWLQPDELEFSEEEIAELDALTAAGTFSRPGVPASMLT